MKSHDVRPGLINLHFDDCKIKFKTYNFILSVIRKKISKESIKKIYLLGISYCSVFFTLYLIGCMQLSLGFSRSIMVETYDIKNQYKT